MTDNLKEIPSDKKFGLTIGFVLFIFAFIHYYHGNTSISFFLGLLVTLLVISSIFKPRILNPLNQLWYKLGLFLGKIVNPLALTLIFIILIVPFAFVMRLFGRDALLMKSRNVLSYWIIKDPDDLDDFKNQY